MQKARRLVLSMLAAGGLAPLLGTRRLLAALPGGTAEAPVAARLAALFAAPASAAAIGRAYLAERPEEADAARLVRGILPGRSAQEIAALDSARLRVMVAARHRGDFAAGRTAELGGWILSRTELRLYALAALHRRAA